MSGFFRSSAPYVLGVVLLCTLPLSAHAAQLKSFAAIELVALDPALPGTEKAHREFAKYLNRQMERGDLRFWSGTKPELSPEGGGLRFVRCTLRTDFPKPLPLGLQCRDYVEQYVGTLRAGTVAELKKTFEWA